MTRISSLQDQLEWHLRNNRRVLKMPMLQMKLFRMWTWSRLLAVKALLES